MTATDQKIKITSETSMNFTPFLSSFLLSSYPILKVMVKVITANGLAD